MFLVDWRIVLPRAFFLSSFWRGSQVLSSSHVRQDDKVVREHTEADGDLERLGVRCHDLGERAQRYGYEILAEVALVFVVFFVQGEECDDRRNRRCA